MRFFNFLFIRSHVGSRRPVWKDALTLSQGSGYGCILIPRQSYELHGSYQRRDRRNRSEGSCGQTLHDTWSALSLQP